MMVKVHINGMEGDDEIDYLEAHMRDTKSLWASKKAALPSGKVATFYLGCAWKVWQEIARVFSCIGKKKRFN